MPEVSLTLLKKHVRADDYDDDDELLAHYLEAAEEAVAGATQRPMEELKEMGGGSLPARLQQAVLMTAAHWYANREAVAGVQMQQVPMGFEALVKPFRRLVHPPEEAEGGEP